jgi:hypothetical protein
MAKNPSVASPSKLGVLAAFQAVSRDGRKLEIFAMLNTRLKP